MDPLSQAALGAAWAQPAARRQRLVAATLAGAGAGMAPDLDVLIRSGSDPLLALEFHRHFTHSLAFVPFGALVCALAFYPLLRRALTPARCYLYCLLGLASHGLLDACTSYGTRLFWPFSDIRVAWDLISVVDPLFTVPLIVLVVLGARTGRRTLAIAGIAWCLAYLGIAAVQHERARAAAVELARDRAHLPLELTVKPSFGNLLVWKAIYAHDGRYYVDAIRLMAGTRAIPGESLRSLDVGRDLPWLDPASQQARDIERFRNFASGYLAVDPDQPNRIIDIRYSLVPNRGDGLWAIEVSPDFGPEQHAAYVTMRVRSAAEGRQLLRMIFQ